MGAASLPVHTHKMCQYCCVPPPINGYCRVQVTQAVFTLVAYGRFLDVGVKISTSPNVETSAVTEHGSCRDTTQRRNQSERGFGLDSRTSESIDHKQNKVPALAPHSTNFCQFDVPKGEICI